VKSDERKTRRNGGGEEGASQVTLDSSNASFQRKLESTSVRGFQLSLE
jgi:hypothetical protein